MALRYNCPICNMEIGYEGLCWKCKAQKEEGVKITVLIVTESLLTFWR